MDKWYYGIYYGLALGGYWIGKYHNWLHWAGWIMVAAGAICLKHIIVAPKDIK